MKTGQTLKLNGELWRVERATPDRAVLSRYPVDLTAWREKKGLTQRQAATLLGISQAQLARIENGTRTCSPGLLDKLT